MTPRYSYPTDPKKHPEAYKTTQQKLQNNFNPTSPITQKYPSTLIGGLGVTITDESENRSIGTNGLQIVGVLGTTSSKIVRDAAASDERE